MRRIILSFVVFVLSVTALSAAPCAPSDTALCLNSARFEVAVSWRDSRGRTGVGQAVSITADTGYFWFFSATNIELVIKVLDARSINGKYWVFFGALSAVEYDLTVTDTATGAVKTYHNDLGNFASVGDTSAFDPSAIPPMTETVTAQGSRVPPDSFEALQVFTDRSIPKAASEFTPCPDTRFGLDLANCRFHIEVEWEDSRGRTGVGQPVQLTSDTGYFWFFSPANVELVIKALDARSVNGKFWVFFGALSSVRYSVTVVDTFTGSFRKYSNPSGTFASVGDTGAFSGGQTVAPVSDAARAASANLDATGGSVSAMGADGTVFTLELPPNALASPQTVTLTPISSLGGLPFSGGLVAGVEIAPAGLDLTLHATLTIQPPSLPSPDRTLPFSYARDGEDFILYPRDPDTSSLRIPLTTLGAYGVVEGSLADAEAQAGRATTGPLNPYVQRYGLEVLRRIAGLITPAELESRGSGIFQDAYDERVAPLLPPGGGVTATGSRLKRTCWFGELHEFLELLFRVIRQRQTFGLSDLEGNPRSGLEIALERIRACAEESFRLCVENHDPGEALLLIKLARDLQVMGLEEEGLTTFAEDSLVERCLRFELEFTSEFKLEAIQPQYSLAETAGYHSKVPLRFLFSGNAYSHRSTFEGICALEPDAAELTVQIPPEGPDCVVSPVVSGRGIFNTVAAQLNLSILSNELWMLYDPGSPSFDASMTCDGYFAPLPFVSFQATYSIVHEGEITVYGFYIANGWRQLRYLGNSPGDWAEKEYVRSFTNWAGPGSTLFEDTRFVLRHTPDAPMPDCE